MIAEAKPEFQHLQESAIMSALGDANSQNAVSIEVGRLVAAYTIDLRNRPSALPVADPPLPVHFPIEAVALRLATKLAGVPVVKVAP
jgi:hypothetical protein